MTSTFLQTRGSGFFLVSEANGTLSRDIITISSAAAAILPVGQVLGKITASGKYIPCLTAAVDGSQFAAAILYNQVDATTDDVEAVGIMRMAEVDLAELVFADTVQGNIDTHVAELLALDVKSMPKGVTSF